MNIGRNGLKVKVARLEEVTSWKTEYHDWIVSTRVGGFRKWGYPNSWMVYKGTSYELPLGHRPQPSKMHIKIPKMHIPKMHFPKIGLKWMT